MDSESDQNGSSNPSGAGGDQENQNVSYQRKGGFIRLVRKPSFAFLWAGSIASSIGSSAGFIAIIWFVFIETGSAIDVAFLGLATLIPRVSFGIFAGALADRFNRVRLMILADLLRASVMILFAASVIFFGFVFGVVLLSVIVLGFGMSLFRPALNSFLPTSVDKRDLGTANGLIGTAQQITSILGAPLGGFLIAIIGISLTIAFNGFTYLISALMIVAMSFAIYGTKNSRPAETKTRPRFSTQVKEGFTYVKGQPALLKLTIASFGANFFLSIFMYFIVVYISVVLGGDAVTLGIISAASGIGFGTGAIMAGRLRSERRFGIWFSVGWGFGALSILGLVLIPQTLPAILFMGLFGLGGGFGNTTFFTGVQKTVPNELLGRYLSIDEVGSLAASPAGMMTGGILITVIGIGLDFAVASIGTVILSLGLLIFSDVRALRAYDSQ